MFVEWPWWSHNNTQMSDGGFRHPLYKEFSPENSHSWSIFSLFITCVTCLHTYDKKPTLYLHYSLRKHPRCNAVVSCSIETDAIQIDFFPCISWVGKEKAHSYSEYSLYRISEWLAANQCYQFKSNVFLYERMKDADNISCTKLIELFPLCTL